MGGKAEATPQSLANAVSERGDAAKTSKGAGSVMSSILLYSTLIGLGIIGGYFVFCNIYNQRCADLLDEAEGRHNATADDLKTRYKSAIEDHHECLNDESVMLELYELRGRLESFETLEKKHQALQEAYDIMGAQLASLESMQKRQSHECETLRQDLNLKAKHMERVVGSKTEELRAVERQYGDCKDRLEEAVLRNARRKINHHSEL